MLAWLSSAGIKALLDWIFEKIMKAFYSWKRLKDKHEKAVNQANQDNEKASKINDGSKSDEVDSSIDDSLKHL